MAEARGKLAVVRIAGTIIVLAGIWLFISPWIYNFYPLASAWNCWVVGALMIAFAGSRLGYPAFTRGISWANCVLGAWTFCLASPRV